MTGKHYKLMPSAYCKYKEQRSETIYDLERPFFRWQVMYLAPNDSGICGTSPVATGNRKDQQIGSS